VPIDDYRHFQRLSADAEVGKKVPLEIIRDRQKRAAELTIAEAPDSPSPTR
jgi:S1-C subfamily serine protease